MMLRHPIRLLPLIAGLFPFFLQAQIFTGTPVQVKIPAVEERLEAWEVYQLDAVSIYDYVQANAGGADITFRLGANEWHMALQANYQLMSNYKLQVLTPEGLQVSTPKVVKAFKGNEVNTNQRVSMTFDRDFVYGCVSDASEKWYIEPLWYYDPSAPRDQFVVYRKSDVIFDMNVTCATVEADNLMEEVLESEDEIKDQAELAGCYTLELAIASDKLMYQKYGTVAAVENHNIGVINNVGVNYSGGNFNNDLEFEIVTQFVVTGTDPWSNSTDAGVLLGSFRTWGNAGNFGVGFDIGELWTNRDFDGSTVGIAYLNAVCNSNKYHCLQDFTNNSEYLRCMTAHEIGHNFSAIHDGSGTCPPNYIMCPFVNTSNDWSTQSSNSINSYMQSKINSGCLAPCGPPVSAPEADFSFFPNPGCPGVPVSFTDLSTGSITSYNWTFQSGTPATSTQANPVVTWNTGGNYTVTLTVYGPGGSNTMTTTVPITPIPVANFTSAVDDLTVTFTDLSTNATSWLWDFGDGGYSNEQNPVYTYGQAGSYVVILTVENDCGTSTKTFPVNTAPTAAFSANQTSGCAPLYVQFTNESSYNAQSFLWNFPGGIPATSTAENPPPVVYTTSGTYNVSLTVYNNSGSNTYTATGLIDVQNIPSSNFTWVINGLTVTFNNSSQGGTTYLWDFGDNTTSTETNPVHTYAVGGTYDVSLTVTNICGSITVTKIIGLTPPPVAAFSAGPTSGCAPLTVQYTNTSSGNPTSFNWQFPGGNPGSSTQQNPSVVYNNSGSYNATLIVTNVGGSDTLTFTNYINVSSVPAPGFTSSINGSVVTFTNTTSGATSYNWNFGDNGTSTATNPVHNYATDGTYTVTLTAFNSCGNNTTTQTVVITLAPTAAFTANPTSGCAALTVQFTNQSSANATSFLWNFPGGAPSSSTATNPLVVYPQPGLYSVTLTATNSAGSGTATQTNYINVGTTPTAAFTSAVNGATASFTNGSTGATSYSWNFGDNGTSTLTNPSHTYAADGTYTVTLTAANSCGNTTTTQTVTIVTPPTAGFSANNTNGCAPFTVQFNNTSSSNATSFQWTFPGGSPASSTLMNPVVVYSQAGTYSVTLTAFNSAGSNTFTQNGYITVGTTPTAGFSTAVNGATANFTNSSTGATSYNWNFGDNGTSTLTNPSHTYAADGTYTVTLTATNSCGNTTTTQTVTIVTPPTAGFSANNTNGCAPFTVQFNNTSSSNATSFQWTFPGGSPASSTLTNPTVVYNQAGTYSVTLTAFNSAGSNTFTQSGYITVGTTPTAGFSTAVNGAIVNFTNNSSGATSYNWDFGDSGTSTEVNPSHTYTADGTYTVTLTATNGCGNTTTTQTVTIVTPPTAGFTSSATSGCLPLTVQFNNTSSSNATSFAWTFEGGTPATSTETNPSATWSQAGTYTVTLTAFNSAGSSTSTTTVTVNAAPTAGFTYQLAGLSVILANTTGNGDTYLWAFGDGGLSNEENPEHAYAGPGAFTVTLTATNECGSTEFSSSVEIQGSAPIAAFSVENTGGCAPFTVQFTDESEGDPTSWQWAFPGGTPAASTEQNPSVTYASPGTYDVSLQVTNLYGTNTTVVQNYISVATTPVVGFTYNADLGTVSFTNQSQNALTYSWNFGDGSLNSNEADPTHTYTANGTYTVELTAVNNCGASTLQQSIIVIVTGIKDAAWVEGFRLYPNPNDGTFQVEMQGVPQEKLRFELHNSVGQLVRTEEADFHTGAVVKLFHYNDLQGGVYALSVISGTNRMVVKMVVHNR